MHEGHRSRLVAKVLGGGIVYEHELLEILLFYACPRRDLNATAHSLIAKFGNLSGVLSKESGDLTKVEGVGANMDDYLVCLGKALRRIGGCNSFAVLHNTEQFKKYLSARPRPESDLLEFCMVDKDGRVRRMCAFGRNVSDGEMLKILSVYKPYGLFVSDRRAVGGFAPDADDDGVTVRINELSKLCGVRFFDYCVVSETGGIYSYKTADRTVFGASSAGG